MRRNLAPLLLLAALLAPSRPLAEALPLPAARKEGKLSVEAALAARRSVRSFARKPLTLAQVAQLLWAAQGVTGADGKRTAPSARHLYPLELVVVAQDVEGLGRGAYRYLPVQHALERLAAAREGEAQLAKASGQPQVQAAPAVFVVAAVYERMDAGERSHAWTDYEAGLASQNLLLEAVALDLGAVVIGGMDPAAARAAVGFGGREQVVVLIPVGHPGR